MNKFITVSFRKNKRKEIRHVLKKNNTVECFKIQPTKNLKTVIPGIHCITDICIRNQIFPRLKPQNFTFVHKLQRAGLLLRYRFVTGSICQRVLSNNPQSTLSNTFYGMFTTASMSDSPSTSFPKSVLTRKIPHTSNVTSCTSGFHVNLEILYNAPADSCQ